MESTRALGSPRQESWRSSSLSWFRSGLDLAENIPLGPQIPHSMDRGSALTGR